MRAVEFIHSIATILLPFFRLNPPARPSFQTGHTARERHSFGRMSTLAEIEMAVPHLAADELSHLERLIRSLRVRQTKKQRSAFDLAPLQHGKVLNAEDDLLDEMLPARHTI